MGKASVEPKTTKNGKTVIRLWYDEIEPPKNYIWVKDDFYYMYKNGRWQPYDYDEILEQIPNDCICEMPKEHHHKKIEPKQSCCQPACPCANYVTPTDLSDRLDKFQKDFLSKIINIIHNTAKGNTSALETYIKDILEPRVNMLELNFNAISNSFAELRDNLITTRFVKNSTYDVPEWIFESAIVK